MKNNEINITIPDGYEIDKDNSTFECIKFTKVNIELPDTWNKFWIDDCKYASIVGKERWDSMPQRYVALRKLELLRDCYNDGWVADWSNREFKSCICIHSNEIKASFWVDTQHPLNFKTDDLRDKFLTNFKDLIEQAKPLL